MINSDNYRYIPCSRKPQTVSSEKRRPKLPILSDFASAQRPRRSWASDMTGEPGGNEARKPGRRRLVDLSGSVLWNYVHLYPWFTHLDILDHCISMELLFINVGRSAIRKKKRDQKLVSSLAWLKLGYPVTRVYGRYSISSVYRLCILHGVINQQTSYRGAPPCIISYVSYDELSELSSQWP